MTEMDKKLKTELTGVAKFGDAQFKQYLVKNSLPVTPEQVDEITRTVTVGGIPGKLFRHNGKVIQYLSNVFKPIPFPTIIREDNEFSYNAITRGITINLDGWYSIKSSISVGITSNRRQTSEYAIFVNGIIQEGSRAYGYHRLSREGNMTTQLQYLLDITKGDVVDIRCREFSYRDQRTLANACNVLIERA